MHNQSRVKGLGQQRAGQCAAVFYLECIGWLFHTDFLRDDWCLTMVAGPDREVVGQGLHSRIFGLVGHR